MLKKKIQNLRKVMLNQKTLVEYKTKAKSKGRIMSQELEHKLKYTMPMKQIKLKCLRKREKMLEAQKRYN